MSRRLNVEGRISVVVPVYNEEDYIEECLISILQQNYNDLEVVVVNDGSTDRSIDIANEVLVDSNRKYNIINTDGPSDHTPLTITWPFLYGMYHSTGEYVTFHSGDNVSLDPSRYSIMLDDLKSSGFRHIFCKVKRLMEDGSRAPDWEQHPDGINIAYSKVIESGDFSSYYSYGSQIPIMDSLLINKAFAIKANVIATSPRAELFTALTIYAHEDYNYTDRTYMYHRIHRRSINNNPMDRYIGREENGYHRDELEPTGMYDYEPYYYEEYILNYARKRLGIK